MSEPSQEVRTITVEYEKVDLPLDVYNQLQEMINEQRGGDALVLLRQHVDSETRFCIAALRETTNTTGSSGDRFSSACTTLGGT